MDMDDLIAKLALEVVWLGWCRLVAVAVASSFIEFLGCIGIKIVVVTLRTFDIVFCMVV